MKKSAAGLVEVMLLATLMTLWMGGSAQAFAPTVQYVSNSTASNSASPKIAVAECPFGWNALGGAGVVIGEKGQVAVQSGFPMYDAGLGKWIFVAKAVEDLDGTAGNWSLTAGVYCTNDTVATIVFGFSEFDSDPLKAATAECPANTRVVGMGGEVWTRDTDPGRLVEFLPPTSVVFQGFEANQDLTKVTARASERDAVFGGHHAGSWKVTAVAACASPAYFGGLESRIVRQTGGWFAGESESQFSVSCSPGKRVIAAGSTIDDRERGHWYLTRFIRLNPFQQTVSVQAQRSSGTSTVKQAAQAICVDT